MSDQHSGHQGDSPLAKLMITVSGASGAEHESEPPGVNAVSVQAGHEPDKFDVRPILYVPALVVIVLVLAYALVSGVFFTIKDPAPTPNANPDMAARLDRPFNERAVAISSSDPNAPVKQPRLEYVKKQGERYENEPAYYRSRLPLPYGNSPELTPQDLRADRFVDPTTGTKLLAGYSRANAEKGLARIPIDDAMADVLKKLPVRKDPVHLPETTAGVSKLSNAGRGGPSQPAAAKPKEAPKH